MCCHFHDPTVRLLFVLCLQFVGGSCRRRQSRRVSLVVGPPTTSAQWDAQGTPSPAPSALSENPIETFVDPQEETVSQLATKRLQQLQTATAKPRPPPPPPPPPPRVCWCLLVIDHLCLAPALKGKEEKSLRFKNN